MSLTFCVLLTVTVIVCEWERERPISGKTCYCTVLFIATSQLENSNRSLPRSWVGCMRMCTLSMAMCWSIYIQPSLHSNPINTQLLCFFRRLVIYCQRMNHLHPLNELHKEDCSVRSIIDSCNHQLKQSSCCCCIWSCCWSCVCCVGRPKQLTVFVYLLWTNTGLDDDDCDIDTLLSLLICVDQLMLPPLSIVWWIKNQFTVLIRPTGDGNNE